MNNKAIYKDDPGSGWMRLTGHGLKDQFLNACMERDESGQPVKVDGRVNEFAVLDDETEPR